MPYASPTETFTFLFTDIEGSTALLKRLGDDAYADVLADHHSVIRSGLLAHDGKEIGTQGDGFFAVFSSPSACVRAVIEMQRALGAHRWPANEQIHVRMGVHSGEASEKSTGLVGFEVHRAARIAAVAHGGQIVLSATSADLVRERLPPDTSLLDLGQHRLKDLGRPEQIFQLQADGLEVNFPPLRSLDNPELANNLPLQSASFVGRAAEVAEVRRLVESNRLVTLTGAGGSGKTRLGLQVAAELLDGSGDGVFLVELAPVADPLAVASAISEALEITSQAGRPALETLLDALAPQHKLIVLDNCEHLIGECAKVASAILRRCPQVRLVATSREPLGIGGETIYRVPSLSLPSDDGENASPPETADAVALFLDRASGQGVEIVLDEETAPLVVSICRRLDGMPLAIELAAARLRALSLQSLSDRLDQRFRLLTGGSRTALPRQQTLRATVDWSYSLLTALEQSVLRRLSVFSDGFDLEAAEAVCGLGDIEIFEVTDLLVSLVDKSLVVADPTGGTVRYRLLETIRQFGAERLVELDESEAAAAATAHCTYFLSLAELAAPHLTGADQGRWCTRLEANQANLRRAIEHAVGDQDGTSRVLRFGVALRRYWDWRVRPEEGVALLLPVLERPEARADPRLFGAALVTIAFVAGVSSAGAARDAGEQAVEIARLVDDERLLIDSLAVLSYRYVLAGDPEGGLPLAEEAVERARLLADDVLLTDSLASLTGCTRLVDPARSAKLITETLASAQRSGDQLLIGRMQIYEIVRSLGAGDIPAARTYLEQAAHARQLLGGVSFVIPVYLAWVLRAEGERESAGSVLQQQLLEGRRRGDSVRTADAVLGLACLATDLGDWQRGATLHGAADAIRDENGLAWLVPGARYREVSIHEARARLGGDEFERSYAGGKGLSYLEAVDLAVGRVRSA